ncbi:hypothetical protein N7492_001712 [Penicillium capsulatum]|uniref:Uncharacterized protein n=1 Tax=Penicillium capsulatum TaxID=69766 RepID=A0A9W9IYA2_9EURO|nr:hypothetical protein N7492_001712 [Penicillium capsulatum]KAJ6129237.1 hypothetical protein N7512_002017 [Penicillium capsulatum]
MSKNHSWLTNVKFVATIDTNRDSCRSTDFNITDSKLLCYTYLTHILHQCDIENHEGDEHASLTADDCTVWSLHSYTSPVARGSVRRDSNDDEYARCEAKGTDYLLGLDKYLADPNTKDIANVPEQEMQQKYSIEWNPIKVAAIPELALVPGVEESDKFWDLDVHNKPNIPGLRYQNRLSPQAGVLQAMSNYGRIGSSKMPQRWSTVIGQLWVHASARDNVPTSNLKWILRARIDNDETIKVLTVVMTRAKVNLKKQPSRLTGMRQDRYTVKKTFKRTDPSFRAILGTPNGKGIPHLLRERKDVLGKKTIRDISVFVNLKTPQFPEWYILFGLSEYNKEDEEDEKEDCVIM